MKKSIFLFFAAILCAIGMNAAETYRYSGEKDGWAGTQMTVSSDGYYSYYGPVTGAHQFKIGTSTNQWAYNHSYVSKGFNNTDITDLGDWGQDNAYCWSGQEHYILVYHPTTKINSENKVKICASTFLPDDSESDLPEPEPEPTELAYNVTVPAGTKACYICGNMTGWNFTEMTKVDDTQYTITIEGAKKTDEYKYASGSDWGYVEKDANGNEMGNRTYVDGNDVVARWASVYDPDAVEQELTYSVTVPEGTYACYIAMDTDPAQEGWEFNEMTKVDDTHYTFTRTGLKNKTYKYTSGPGWEYVELTAEDGNVADRTWAENDVVAKWTSVYNPTAPTYDYYITGSLVGGWGVKQQGIEKDGELYKATFTELNAGIYEFKITAGDWDHQWNYNNLGAAYEEVSQGVDGEGKPNGNIKIVTEEAKTITVIFDATAGKITLGGLTPYVAPLTYTVTVPAGTEKCYIAGSMNGWAFQEMEAVTGETNKFTITIIGAKETDEYKYACQADWAYAEVIDGGGNRTNWSELDEVTAWNKPVVYTYYLMGVNDDWATGIEMEVNTEAENEVMLTCQPVNGAVKIKRVGDDDSEYWYGGNSLKTADGSLGTNTSTDGGDGDILLEEGIYNFYFNTADGKLWIAAATDCEPTPDYTREVDLNQWGTICLPNASSNFTGATFYEVSSLDPAKGLWLDQLKDGDQLVAGKPYIFYATATEITVTYTDAAPVPNPVAGENGLTGTFTDIAADGDLVGNYIIAENKVWVAGATATLPAYRAYISSTVPTTAQAEIPGRRRVCMGENAATGLDQIVAPEGQAVKAIVNGQLIIIRDGVKYNVQGQVIK